MATGGLREGLKLLRQPNFARGFFAYMVSFSGTAMAPIAMAFGVLELTGSAKASAIVIAAPAAAQVLLLMFSGTIADRTSRQKLLISSDVLAMGAQVIIAALFLSGVATVPLLTGMMLILGVAFSLNGPAATGFIPQIVEAEELQAANALLSVARNSALTVGAAIAGVLVAFVGPGITLLIDGITFGLSAILIAGIRPRAQEKPAAASLAADLRLGWTEFTKHTWLWAIVVQFALVVAAAEAVWGLIGPAVARDQLGGAVVWGFVAASTGVGTLMGGLLAMYINVQRKILLATCLVFFFSSTSLALSVPLPVWVICVAAWIGGVTGQLFGVLWFTTLHKTIPSHLLSRVAAYDHLGSIALAPLGIVVSGMLYEWIGARPTLLIAAATIIIPTLLVLMVKEVRELRVE
jgi:MFS family permease